MNEKTSGIILKLIAAVAFLGGIVGGGYLAVTGFGSDDFKKAAVGLAIVVGAVFVIACLVPWIARADGHADWEAEEGRTTVLSSIKTGLMFTFFAAVLIFVFIGIYFWVARDMWQLGVAAVAALFIMIIIAIEVSIRFQTKHSRIVMKSKNAEDRIGKITSVSGQFPILFFGAKKYFIKVYTVEIDGIKSQAFLRASNRLAKRLCTGAEVNVKIIPKYPRYCAICDAVIE